MAHHPGLTEAQIEQYRTNGYLVLDRFFDAGVLSRVDATIQQIADEAIGGGDHTDVLELEPEPVNGKPVVRRLYHPFDRHPVFRELATDDRLLDCVQSLIGPDISLQHSKLNMKPAHVGSAVEWHQDMAYFPHTNDDLITLLIYLDDATEENGCLRVLPRHHTHYFNHARPDGTFAGMITEPLESGAFGRPVELAAPAGSVILMHCVTPHSSLSNRTSKNRRTLIFEYRANDSFPIYCGKSTVLAEAEYRLIRGKPARCARFGGPPPPMPNMTKFHSSLYALQEATRAELGDSVPAVS